MVVVLVAALTSRMQIKNLGASAEFSLAHTNAQSGSVKLGSRVRAYQNVLMSSGSALSATGHVLRTCDCLMKCNICCCFELKF